MLALQESMLAILKGGTSGFPEEDPPWGIEGEPEGKKIFDLKSLLRPTMKATIQATLATKGSLQKGDAL